MLHRGAGVGVQLVGGRKCDRVCGVISDSRFQAGGGSASGVVCHRGGRRRDHGGQQLQVVGLLRSGC
jgi:hypothetical protein